MEERIAAPEQPPQPISITRRVTSSLQYHSMTLGEKVKYAAWGGGLSAAALELFGAGTAGLGLAVLIAFGSGFWSEELQTGLVKKLPRPRENKAARQSKLHWWLTGETLPTTPIAEPGTAERTGDTLEVDTGQDSGTGDIDALFQPMPEQEEAGIARLMPNDIIRNTELDSYLICIGRSLTRQGNPPVWINFYGQHLKLIGASQYGKSSMAAAILYLITRTHAPESVLIALLDMEHKTSKLFADIPHLAHVNINGNWTPLHAKTREQVLQHLNHIVAIMNERYSLSEAEVEQEPILLVYLEEFLALKDYFKRQIDKLLGEAKEQAKKDYAELVFAVSEIARRGLKVKVQLLMCAQVDYRDDDFREALVNITGGMSFCVDSTAARAAGFVRSDLLKRNVEDDKKGQAVVETPDCKDLVLAVEYNLKKKLLDFEKERLRNAGHKPEGGKRRSMLAAASNPPTREPEPPARTGEQEEASDPAGTPTLENQRKLTSLHRQALEHYQPGIGYRQLGDIIGVGKDKAGDLLDNLPNKPFELKEPRISSSKNYWARSLLKDLKKWGMISDDE